MDSAALSPCSIYFAYAPTVPKMAPTRGKKDLVRCNQLHLTTSSFANPIPVIDASTLLTCSKRNSSLFIGTIKNHVNGTMLNVVTPANANVLQDFFAPRFLTAV